jgi:hypothetical protein
MYVPFVILAMDFTDLDDDDKDSDYKPESESEDDLEANLDLAAENNIVLDSEGKFDLIKLILVSENTGHLV